MRKATNLRVAGAAFFLLPLVLFLVSACTPKKEGAEVGEALEKAASAVEDALDKPETPLSAKAEVDGGEVSKVTGVVTFVETLGGVMINGEFSGLEPGKHGFHIHEIGDCSAANFESAGGHFNPEGVEHGSPLDPIHHAGDLGNLDADDLGHASYSGEVADIDLEEGSSESVVGRAVIVHRGADDFETQPSGASGPRIACGVIELTKPASSASGEQSTS